MSDPDAIRQLSIRREVETGADSIPTIERVYERTGDVAYPPSERRGAICCCFPGCSFHSLSAEKVWRHVHFSPRKHGLHFVVRTPEELLVTGEPS